MTGEDPRPTMTIPTPPSAGPTPPPSSPAPAPPGPAGRGLQILVFVLIAVIVAGAAGWLAHAGGATWPSALLTAGTAFAGALGLQLAVAHYATGQR